MSRLHRLDLSLISLIIYYSLPVVVMRGSIWIPQAGTVRPLREETKVRVRRCVCGRSTMKRNLRAGALMLFFAAGVAAAGAQTGGITEPSTALRLTPQQRTEIYAAVGKNKLRTPPPPDLPVA